MGPGQFKPGSLSARTLAAIQAGNGRSVSRNELLAELGDGRNLNRILDRLVVRGLVVETGRGLRPAGACSWVCGQEPRPPAPLQDGTRWALAAILNRAHSLRAAGLVERAVQLLECAAKKIDLPHVRADLLALGDLFRCGEHLYGEAPAARAA